MTYDPLLDSSNMGMQDWAKMASDIKENYCDFDAFIILHGTDTMCYTASALSFMLENLGKTVIVTGSQVVCGGMFGWVCCVGVVEYLTGCGV